MKYEINDTSFLSTTKWGCECLRIDKYIAIIYHNDIHTDIYIYIYIYIRPTKCMVAASCRIPSLSGHACAWKLHFIKLRLGDPLMILPRHCLLNCFSQGDTSARQRGIELRALTLLGELSKAIEPHLSVYQ